MLEIVVASGKGGTGKTSLVGALAELAQSAVLVDCDVDAANLHLILRHRILEKSTFSGSRRASIDVKACLACGLCAESCRFGAISQTPDQTLEWGVRFAVDPLACEGCGLCARLCPSQAVAFGKVVSGEWFLSESAFGPFLHARLGIAQSNSGRLVSLLRQRARELAREFSHELVIVDGPPGIGCPVIAALTNSSYLLIVTEPSLSAVHDMTRLVELADHFQIKTGICVNKCDINYEISRQVEQFGADHGIVIHGQIPYDPSFTQAQLKGQSYLRTASKEGIERMKRIWESVLSDAGRSSRADARRFVV